MKLKKSITLEESHCKKFVEIGNGNLSKGMQKQLEYCSILEETIASIQASITHHETVLDSEPRVILRQITSDLQILARMKEQVFNRTY